MKSLITLGFAALLMGCQAPRPKPEPLAFAGGDGSSREQAVIILKARHREVGLLAETMWLQRKYPGCHHNTLVTLNAASRHYDRFEIATAEGNTRRVYFDTTEFADK
jgi:hypothetical protein